MNQYTWEIVSDARCQLGECPVWDRKRQRILWIDILSGILHSYDPIQNEYFNWHTGQITGSIALTQSGAMLAAVQGGFAIVDPAAEQVKMLASVETDRPTNRFNDGKCDPAGRFWAGTMSTLNTINAGSLYTLEKDLSVTKKIEGLTCSNGMAWSPDHSLFYFIDTPTLTIMAYEYNILNGNIDNGRIAIRLAAGNGYPDGMTIDTEGMLWIALWDAGKVARFNPLNGELLLELKLPVTLVTSCTFGGAALNDLYITTARTGLTEEVLQEQPLAGSLFVIRGMEYNGCETFLFDG